MANTFYVEQTGFTSGEVSPAVGNRTDLEKFPYALARAKNCYISPYGPVSKRQGSVYVTETKYSDRKCILERFIFTQEEMYLLEVGHQYIRVYYNDQKVAEVNTPYDESILKDLRFNQSRDVILITSGKHKPHILSRYGHTDWRLEEFPIDQYPLQSINGDKSLTISATGLSGHITLNANKAVFKNTMVGTDIELIHDIAENNRILDQSGTTDGLYCAEWRVKTNGFWEGTVWVERSINGNSWEVIRTYNGKEDTNVDESGIFPSPSFVRLRADVRKGKQNFTFKGTIVAKPRIASGRIRITRVINETTAEGDVIERLGATTATADWRKSYWSNGTYPRVGCWWQDRLFFCGLNDEFIPTIWGSRTSDYTNFSVEKAGGDLTDDSACIFPLISKEVFQINWIIGGQDLLILADSVEYRVDGTLIVTPKNFQASVQSGRGSNNCRYQFIGNQILFVQSRGGTVREMGFDETQNSYTGDDLTILAKHLVEEKALIDSCYMQEPHSMVYFVRDDGVICCLAYIKEQKVYAWSTVETKGNYESLIAIPERYLDNLYVVVQRTVKGQTKRFIEKFKPIYKSDKIYDYVMSDCMIERKSVNSNKITGLNVLSGETVNAVFTHDENLEHWLQLKVSDNGVLELPYVVKDIKVGLPYETQIVTLNIEQKLPGIGTIQGKEKQLVGVNLRVMNSHSGKIGQSYRMLNKIPYRNEKLVTGDIKCDIPGDRNIEGRLYIVHSEPTPFTLLSLVREVSL